MANIPGLRAGTASTMIVFDGQSLNTAPAWDGDVFGHAWGWHLLHDVDQYDLGRPSGGIAHAVPAIGGQSWTTLATTVSTRVYPLAPAATTTVLVMFGGTTDINSGDSGATFYADHVSYADGCRAAGFDFIVAATLPDSTSFDAAEDTARADGNALLLADADLAFDAVADLTTGPLEDATDVDYFFDGTHIYGPGPIVVAQAVGAVLWPLL